MTSTKPGPMTVGTLRLKLQGLADEMFIILSHDNSDYPYILVTNSEDLAVANPCAFAGLIELE